MRWRRVGMVGRDSVRAVTSPPKKSSFGSTESRPTVRPMIPGLRSSIRVPSRARRPGRSMAHQTLVSVSSSRRISKWPPVWGLRPRSRAGMTRESFNTSTSPLRRWSSRRETGRCSMDWESRRATSRRDWSRAGGGPGGDQCRAESRFRNLRCAIQTASGNMVTSGE